MKHDLVLKNLVIPAGYDHVLAYLIKYVPGMIKSASLTEKNYFEFDYQVRQKYLIKKFEEGYIPSKCFILEVLQNERSIVLSTFFGTMANQYASGLYLAFGGRKEMLKRAKKRTRLLRQAIKGMTHKELLSLWKRACYDHHDLVKFLPDDVLPLVLGAGEMREGDVQNIEARLRRA